MADVLSESQKLAGLVIPQQRVLICQSLFSGLYSEAGGRSLTGTSPASGSFTQMAVAVLVPLEPAHPSNTTCGGTGGGGEGGGDSITGQAHAVQPTGASQHAHVKMLLLWQFVAVDPE